MNKIEFEKKWSLDFTTEEAYKTIRTNIQFSGTENKIILVTSCFPDEGKSSIVMELAVTLAQISKKVLVIDADLRNSVLINRYRISGATNGLSHYLSGQCNIEDIINTTDINSLSVILSGKLPPNPSELLENDRFKELLVTVRNDYDYILIDSSPLVTVIDAAIIAGYCDGALLVISQNRVSTKVARKVIDQLKRSQCKIIGAIFNKVNTKEERYYKKYYKKCNRKYLQNQLQLTLEDYNN